MYSDGEDSQKNDGEAMQTSLGLEPDTPSAGHMCTAETMRPGCKMGGIDKDKEH